MALARVGQAMSNPRLVWPSRGTAGLARRAALAPGTRERLCPGGLGAGDLDEAVPGSHPNETAKPAHGAARFAALCTPLHTAGLALCASGSSGVTLANQCDSGAVGAGTRLVCPRRAGL